MSLLRLYTRVLELLGKEARLGWLLAFANLLLAASQFAEPVLFGRIVDVLAHELAHATLGSGVGHGRLFKQCVLKLGLCGPMRATTAGLGMVILNGPVPAGALANSAHDAPVFSNWVGLAISV